jgi:prepilin-type N-terminal cleavage/methylation domain-containing protein
MKNKRGFSLVELLVTLAFMAILLVLVGKTGRSTIQRSSFTSAVNGFVADLSLARQLAARENRYVAIDFDEGGTQYIIKLQQRVGVSPMNENNYDDVKTVSPMGGEQFLEAPQDFAVNSAGFTMAYPVNPALGPVSVALKFIKKKNIEALAIEKNYDYEKDLTIFPSGGIRIETKK